MKIGIIGGGQLAQMMCESSPEHEYFVLEKNKNCSCKEVARIIEGNYHDSDKLQWLLKNTDVITYEFENIPADSIKQIQAKTYPNPEILHTSQNRLREKNMAKDLGLKTPRFFAISNQADLSKALEELNYRGILKTNTGGYDGKGQVVMTDGLTEEAIELVNNHECILEELLELKYETAIIATRDRFGNVQTFPLTDNVHRNSILFSTMSGLKCKHQQSLERATKKIMNHKNVVGTLVVEYFITSKGWAFNEMAPRPHNSGHWTIEGCSVSQFRNHILAITGEEIQRPRLLRPTIMINVIGKEYLNLHKIPTDPEIYIQDYLKTDVRPGRKMAHITISSESRTSMIEKSNEVISILGGNNE